MTVDTLPKFLKQKYELYGNKKMALREKDLGIWQPFTWQDYYENVKYFSLGLVSLGLVRGDKVAILGETKPEAYFAELGAHAAGGISVGIFTDCGPQEVKYFLEHSDSRFIVVNDQEQVDKILEIKDDLPLLKKVIFWEEKGLWEYDDPILIDFKEVQKLGREYEKLHPGAFEESIEKGKSDDIAIFMYTSGTTGTPKGAMSTHQGLINLTQTYVDMDGWNEHEQYVSFLPLAWIGEQNYGIGGTVVAGRAANFPERAETVQENIREIGAQILMFAPRQWESLSRTVQAKIADANPLKRFFYHLMLPVGYKLADMRLSWQRPNLFWRIINAIAYFTTFRPLLDKLGLLGIRTAYTGGSAISPQMIEFWGAIGIDMRQSYGSTEMSLISAHRAGEIRPESSGTPLRGVQIRLSEEGEIQIKSPNIFAGYYKNPEATQKKFNSEGWFCSGDFGYIDEWGHLVCIDRMDDLTDLAGGRKFSPQFTEIRLRFSPYIKDVLAIGGKDKPFVSIIINIDLDNVGRWAEAKHLAYTTFTDLSQKEQVVELIRKDILKVNKYLPEHARVKKFVNLPKEFDPDEAELTRTRKIRRTYVEERYRDVINAVYSNAPEVMVETKVTYQDGRTATVKNPAKVNTVDEEVKG